MDALREHAIKAREEIANILGVTPDDVQQLDAEDLIYGFLMEAKGRGIQDGVMARVRARAAA